MEEKPDPNSGAGPVEEKVLESLRIPTHPFN